MTEEDIKNLNLTEKFLAFMMIVVFGGVFLILMYWLIAGSLRGNKLLYEDHGDLGVVTSISNCDGGQYTRCDVKTTMGQLRSIRIANDRSLLQVGDKMTYSEKLTTRIYTYYACAHGRCYWLIHHDKWTDEGYKKHFERLKKKNLANKSKT